MDKSAVFDGKVYVFRVKLSPEKDWDAPDVIYGLGHEGKGGLTFTKMKHICKSNGRYFLAKKANVATDKSCTLAEISFRWTSAYAG